MNAGGLCLAKGNNAEHLGGNLGVFSPWNEHSSVELGFRAGAGYLGLFWVTDRAKFRSLAVFNGEFLQRTEMHG